MDSGTDDNATLRGCNQGRRHQHTHRRKNERRIERFERLRLRIAGPCRIERAGENLALGAARLGESEDVLAAMQGNLDGGAKAVQTEPPGLAAHAQRAVADQPGAHQRRRFAIAEFRQNGKAKPLVRHGVFGIIAVDLIAGETRPVAQILAADAAEFADATRPTEPRHADTPQPFSVGTDGFDNADNLVSGYQGQLGLRQLAVDVQVGTANAAGVHPDENLAGPGRHD